jgi:hypothetical protein
MNGFTHYIVSCALSCLQGGRPDISLDVLAYSAATKGGIVFA